MPVPARAESVPAAMSAGTIGSGTPAWFARTPAKTRENAYILTVLLGHGPPGALRSRRKVSNFEVAVTRPKGIGRCEHSTAQGQVRRASRLARDHGAAPR